MNKYILTIINKDEYLCKSMEQDLHIEDYFEELEQELINKKLLNKIKISFDISINKELNNDLHTYFENGKLSYSYLLEQ